MAIFQKINPCVFKPDDTLTRASYFETTAFTFQTVSQTFTSTFGGSDSIGSIGKSLTFTPMFIASPNGQRYSFFLVYHSLQSAASFRRIARFSLFGWPPGFDWDALIQVGLTRSRVHSQPCGTKFMPSQQMHVYSHIKYKTKAFSTLKTQTCIFRLGLNTNI